jgi:hypothetical protein
MFGVSADTLFSWANVVYLGAVAVAAVASFAIYQLSARIGADKDRELQKFQSEARVQIEDAQAKAAQAEARAAELLKSNTELQIELQHEQSARSAMLVQLQPRDMTRDQMDQFVASIRGKVTELHVFTIPDPEAAVYGFTVLEALQRAGVAVSWYRLSSSVIPVEGVASTGMTIYEYPATGEGGAGHALMEAFYPLAALSTPGRHLEVPCTSTMDHDATLPLAAKCRIPSPALFIALKPPAFLDFPDYLKTREMEALRPPWE